MQPIDIKLTRDVIDKTSRRLTRGTQLRTTRAELQDREIPEGAYQVIDRASGLPAPTHTPPPPPPAPASTKAEPDTKTTKTK